MTIGNKEISQIVIYSSDDEVLAVISDKEIIEKNGVNVALS